MMFEGANAEDLADWRSDPITEHLAAKLIALHKELSAALETKASGDNHHHVLAALGGKCVLLRDLIRAIKGEGK